MGSRLLCSVTICLLGAGLVDSGVTQTPKYLIKSRKQQVTLRCSPESGHLYVSWYQQAPGQGPQFLVQYYDGGVNEKGNMPDRFSGKQFSDARSELNLSSLELTDSAVYLCASSQDTALHDQVPLGQKHPCPSSGSGAHVSSASLPRPVSGRVIDFPRHLPLGMFIRSLKCYS
uniref:Ig-like domain-containing protein n=1 Tax=Moschus moschiferus TaxID=68415 RepID=A0A8C6CGD1_MOSMO